jgi:hypothetical protein
MTLLILIPIGTAYGAVAKPFAKGRETFAFKDSRGAAPTFRVLHSTPSKRALAIAAGAALNAQPEVKPKVPIQPYVDLKIESITFESLKGDQLAMRARVSGYDVEIGKTVSRKDFLSGKTIDVRFEPQERSVALFYVKFRDGNLKFRFDKKSDVIHVENAQARLDFSTPLGSEETEALQFKARGKRVSR